MLRHEFAGTVRALGAGVDDLALGDAVAVAPIETCGTCFSCRSGHPNTCRRLALYGGLAQYAVVSRRAVFRVPDGLGVAEASLAEPVAVAVHAARRVR